MHRLIVLAGPSCVGKSPLLKALRAEAPDLLDGVKTLVLYNSRDPRPGEVDGEDYHFRWADEIQALSEDDRFRVMKVRGDTQAIDLKELRDDLTATDVIYEGNPFVGEVLVELDLPDQAQLRSAFISPLRSAELQRRMDPDAHADVESFVADVMRRKLLRRTSRQKGLLAQGDLEEIERRCTSAFRELQKAWKFGPVIVNHDGEDSENWDAFTWPVGEAGLAVEAVMELLRGQSPQRAENWPPDFLQGV
jgi:guanylate kinase